jgi:hypothetical protein
VASSEAALVVERSRGKRRWWAPRLQGMRPWAHGRLLVEQRAHGRPDPVSCRAQSAQGQRGDLQAAGCSSGGHLGRQVAGGGARRSPQGCGGGARVLGGLQGRSGGGLTTRGGQDRI